MIDLERNRSIGLTVLMIEQNARQVLRISHRDDVPEVGRPTDAGPSVGPDFPSNEWDQVVLAQGRASRDDDRTVARAIPTST